MKYRLQYVFTLVTAVIEQLLFSGLIFGWSSINFVLKRIGYFNSCNVSNSTLFESTIPANSSTNSVFSYTTLPASSPTEVISSSANCKFQDETLNLVFTIASVVLSFSTFPNGFIFDKFGTWVARVIAIILVTVGAVLISVSTVETAYLLFPAMCGLSVGGILLLVTNMQIGALFGTARSSVITLLNGALDSSSVVFLLVKIAYENGIDLSSIFQFLSWCTVFLWFRTFVLMPHKHIPYPLPKEGFQYGLPICKTKKLSPNDTEMKLNDSDESTKAVALEEKESYWVCVKTMRFWTNVLHFGVLQLRNYFFLGTLDTWMKSILPPDSTELSQYLSVFGICQFFGIFFAPLNGLLIDVAIQRLRKSCSNVSVVYSKSIAFSAFITSSWGMFFSLLLLIPSVELQYVSFVVQVLFRSFLYGGNSSFLALLFPAKHFGKLYGLTMTVGGIIALLQFPLFSLVLRVFEENYLVMNLIFLFVTSLTYVHPIILYINSNKLQNQKDGNITLSDGLFKVNPDESETLKDEV